MANAPRHIGKLKVNSWAVYADAVDALGWKPAAKEEAGQRFAKFNGGFARSAEIAIGDATALAMRWGTTGDVWATDSGIALCDAIPRQGSSYAWKKELIDEAGARMLAIRGGGKVRRGGVLHITSGCLAILNPGKKPGFTEAAIRSAKKPVVGKGYLLIPLANGAYEITYQALGSRSSGSVHYEDNLGTWATRVIMKRTGKAAPARQSAAAKATPAPKRTAAATKPAPKKAASTKRKAAPTQKATPKKKARKGETA